MAPAGQYTMIVQSIAAHRREFPVTIEEGKENHFADIEIRENIQSARTGSGYGTVFSSIDA